jgi:hypothetical protein
VHEGGEDAFVIRHRAPDVVTHLYQPRGINEPVLLYRGPFNTQGDERSERPYDGDVRLAWLPTPRIEARGERDTAPSDIEALLESGADTNIWQQRLQVHLPGTAGVPPLRPRRLLRGRTGPVRPTSDPQMSIHRISATALP